MARPKGTVSNPGAAPAASSIWDRGLPSVPRGQSREMTAYLQSVHNILLSMSGLGRGTTETRAMRISERVVVQGGRDGGNDGNGKLAAGSVGTVQLADGAVTSAKLAISAVESRNIKPQAVDTAALRAGAVITAILADKCVTKEKLHPELIPQVEAGNAAMGRL